MARPITLLTSQWADLPFAEVAQKAGEWGYDGLEVAIKGDHLDVHRGTTDPDYCQEKLDFLAQHSLKVFAINACIASQLIGGRNESARSDAWAPAQFAGDPEAKRTWAIEATTDAARAAANLGINIVTGCSGSPIWHLLYSQPTNQPGMIEAGQQRIVELFDPVLDMFDEIGVKFALEVMPTQIAYDIVSAHKAVELLGHHASFGFNFDPSHLQWQLIDPAQFIREFPDRVHHVHMKDTAMFLNGRTGILGSHLSFGHPERSWDFRSPGRGDVNFEAIIRELNRIYYEGPLSVEWEDTGMDREHGAREAVEFIRKLDFRASTFSFETLLKQD